MYQRRSGNWFFGAGADISLVVDLERTDRSDRRTDRLNDKHTRVLKLRFVLRRTLLWGENAKTANLQAHNAMRFRPIDRLFSVCASEVACDKACVRALSLSAVDLRVSTTEEKRRGKSLCGRIAVEKG